MTDEKKYTTVSIPTHLHKKIEEKIKGTGFHSVSSYVTYVMRQLVSSTDKESEEAFSKEDEEKVKELARCVELSMASLGFEEEKRDFKAHLTLGRVKGPKGKDALKEAFETIDVKPASTSISKVILYRSELTGEGSIYTPLAECEFGG